MGALLGIGRLPGDLAWTGEIVEAVRTSFQANPWLAGWAQTMEQGKIQPGQFWPREYHGAQLPALWWNVSSVRPRREACRLWVVEHRLRMGAGLLSADLDAGAILSRSLTEAVLELEAVNGSVQWLLSKDQVLISSGDSPVEEPLQSDEVPEWWRCEAQVVVGVVYRRVEG